MRIPPENERPVKMVTPNWQIINMEPNAPTYKVEFSNNPIYLFILK